MLNRIVIPSPKNNGRPRTGWEGFFPYYAGYPTSFARDVISSIPLEPRSMVFDPWNGTGTTTNAARQLGHRAIGFDLNPAMIIVARARMLPSSEADSLEPLSQELLAHYKERHLTATDPLQNWFDPATSGSIRALERSICKALVGRRTITEQGIDVGALSSLASAFYVALFSICRELVKPFRSSNPTWLRKAASPMELISVSPDEIQRMFLARIKSMAAALEEIDRFEVQSEALVKTTLADSTSSVLPEESVDLVLTSPPYCTRIDYTSATRIELSVLHSLLQCDVGELSRKMTGSIRVPQTDIAVKADWGRACGEFLKNVAAHSSKASAGYYLKTHLDYFNKMASSLDGLSKALKVGGAAILVVQDSYYKDVHNDLPAIIGEMAAARGLSLRRKDDFHIRRSMSGINRRANGYARTPGAVESVLVFERRKI